MDELRVEAGVNGSFRMKLMRSGLKWAGAVERMGDEKLAEMESGEKKERKTENMMGGLC